MIGIVLISRDFAQQANLDEQNIAPIAYLREAGANAIYLVGNKFCFNSVYGILELPEIEGVTCSAVDFNPFHLSKLLNHFSHDISCQKVCIIDAAYKGSDNANVANQIKAHRNSNDSKSYGFYTQNSEFPLEIMGHIAFRDIPKERSFCNAYLLPPNALHIPTNDLICFFILSNSAIHLATSCSSIDNHQFLNEIHCQYEHHPVNPYISSKNVKD